MAGKPYSLLKRKNAKYYYVRFRKQDGNWTNAVSTRETAKPRAEAFAIEYLRKSDGYIIDKTITTFRQFSKNFFSWGGEWALDKQAIGKRLSERQCMEKQRQTEMFLVPEFGEKKLFDIKRDDIKQFRNRLYTSGLSGSTINKILSNLSSILETAFEKELIQHVPKIEKVSNIPAKIKGVLSLEETQKLFAIEWKNYIAYVMNFTAAATAMRRGELLALQIKNFHGGYIDVTKSYDMKMHRMNSTTKNGTARRVTVPGRVSDEITKLISMNPYKAPESFIFYSRIPEQPIDGEHVTRCLYSALECIGIDTKEREERRITFHSWRAALNSWL
ncbi:MAG TPA: site-specific integrase, partial [Spirochaetota bacterium]|nr:site-specific integrase [Spirochaetota bacterium]